MKRKGRLPLNSLIQSATENQFLRLEALHLDALGEHRAFLIVQQRKERDLFEELVRLRHFFHPIRSRNGPAPTSDVPPSIRSVAPVTYAAAGETRKVAASQTSSIVP